ncbi:hypothetical protein [Actinokineospora cianjurensis]|uniref:Uncharacterized protein n=1 Tax=Actinokineospora cianjurensis TaxID=585224 RepID=A0A421BCA6_9PSEU|nr:hypothetical protein [Actinokineospora cianjurensis]RLK61973.1 hypothetical protein CLV68_2523 [Actinokineospora cianjurensis]
MTTDPPTTPATLERQARAAIKTRESTDPALAATRPPHAPRPDHMSADLPTRLAELQDQVRTAIKNRESTDPTFAATRPPQTPGPTT